MANAMRAVSSHPIPMAILSPLTSLEIAIAYRILVILFTSWQIVKSYTGSSIQLSQGVIYFVYVL